MLTASAAPITKMTCPTSKAGRVPARQSDHLTVESWRRSRTDAKTVSLTYVVTASGVGAPDAHIGQTRNGAEFANGAVVRSLVPRAVTADHVVRPPGPRGCRISALDPRLPNGNRWRFSSPPRSAALPCLHRANRREPVAAHGGTP